MLKNLFFLFLLIAGITAAGIRFHPEAISGYLHLAKTQFVRLDLKAGNFVVGEVIEQNQDHIRLKMGNGKIVFSRSEIINMKPISDEDMQAGTYSEWILEEPKKPIFTQRVEDSILPLVTNSVNEVVSNAASGMMKGQQNINADVAEALKQVDLTKNLESKHKKSVDQAVREAEGGQ